jgi:hypothetical protein
MTLSNSSISSSYTTGALVITGGVGIGGALNTNSNITANGQLITTIAGQGFSHNDGTINLVSYVNCRKRLFWNYYKSQLNTSNK